MVDQPPQTIGAGAPAATLEDLVLRCLQAPGDVDELCRRNPEHAGALRRRMERLREIGLDSAGPFAAAPARGIPEVDRFVIGERLGEGGMGEVWRAEQTAPVRRTVALKVIRAGSGSERVLARFESERQALARLQHPGIAQVFEVGTTRSGQPWFAMESYPAGR